MAGSQRDDFIEAIRASGDLVQLVSEYVPLRPAGTRMKGLCPFHEEKTPSFSVDPQRQLFYCFGCQTGGDLFKFVQLYEKLSFPEAAEMLARRFGVPIPDQKRKTSDPAERLFALNRAAHEWFRSNLTGVGQECRSYLEQRHIDDETVERLGLGYAPAGWEGLGAHLLSQHYRPEELLTAGLALQRKSGSGQYDRFRNRLIFPIHDLRGRTIAFGGRALGDDQPKYINSPETPAYTKGDHLYGLDLAGQAIRREGQAIVVEGYLDLAALVRSGIQNVVASLGTAFTSAQARLLARFANRVVFSYDGDAAGAKATIRSLDQLLGRGFDVRVVELPGGTDPDDFIVEHGAEAYAERVANAPEYLEFLIRREARRDLSRVSEQVAAVQAVLPHLARLTGAVERSSWASRLADALRLDQEWIVQELRDAVRGSRPKIRERVEAPRERQPITEAESQIVRRLLQSADERAHAAETLDISDLDGKCVQPIVQVLLGLEQEGKTVDYPTLLDALGDDGLRELLTEIAFSEHAPEQGATVEGCLWSFKRERISREGRQVRREIAQLQSNPGDKGSPSEIDQQLLRLQRLARERDALS